MPAELRPSGYKKACFPEKLAGNAEYPSFPSRFDQRRNR